MANSYVNRGSASLIISEMVIQTTITYHLIPVGRAIIKKPYTFHKIYTNMKRLNLSKVVHTNTDTHTHLWTMNSTIHL